MIRLYIPTATTTASPAPVYINEYCPFGRIELATVKPIDYNYNNKNNNNSNISYFNNNFKINNNNINNSSSSKNNNIITGTNNVSSYYTSKELQFQLATVQQWQIYLIFIALTLFAFIIAQISKKVNKALHKEQDSVDTDFDAGRESTSGVISTTLVSYWTWAATLLQSSTVTAKYGISGAYWYASGASVQILLFSVLIVMLKVKAPGAKTYLQVIRARFDKKTHLIFCAFALATNFVVTAMLMLGGTTILTSMVNDLSIEMGTILVVVTIFTYTFVGGLSATMYVSYFNTAVMVALVLVFLHRVFYANEGGDGSILLGSIDKIFSTLTCLKTTSDNLNNSFLTMYSVEGLIFGVINIVGNFGAVFVDQSYWQCGVAAKPLSAVVGFVLGSLTWFSIPLTFGTTMGLAFRSIQVLDRNSTSVWMGLDDDAISKGLVAPYAANRLMGSTGSLLCVILVVMAVTSTGASQIIAVTSVLVYDVYQLYLKPFRSVLDCNTCLLCGFEKGRKANVRSKNICKCVSMLSCKTCQEDNKVRTLEGKRKPIKTPFTCPSHAPYRTYNEYVQRLKNWCQVIFTIAILPLTVVLKYTAVSLGWLYLFMGVIIGSAVPPIILALFWARLSGKAMSCGAIGGLVCGLVAWLAVSGWNPDGKDGSFYDKTGKEMSMLAGNLTSIISGTIITIAISLISNRSSGNEDKDLETWEMTRDIDNPLRPWTELYSKELNLAPTELLDSRPSLQAVEMKYKSTKYLAIFLSTILTIVLVFVWPALFLIGGILDRESFKTWINIITSISIVATLYIIIWPPISEIWRIKKTLRDHNQIHGTTAYDNTADLTEINKDSDMDENGEKANTIKNHDNTEFTNFGNDEQTNKIENADVNFSLEIPNEVEEEDGKNYVHIETPPVER